jgi:adenine-specific DNA-methyltransferase
MPIQALKPANFFDEERLAALKTLAPEAFADGKINWSTLKDALGGELEEDEEEAEHFGLSWPGKREARRLAGKPSTGTLVPAKGEGVDEADTRNIYIEGENLEVLKLLRKAYTGRVKMIYIDPPYNTGNDFVYDDDFSEPLQDYLRRTGQIDGEGRPTTTNKKADGRFHSRWLSMMYPRLRLARELLRDDGVIFVSIDDNEVHHLRMLMNEVFGEENFVANIVWQKRYTRSNNTIDFTTMTEPILAYAKSEDFIVNLLERNEEADSRYSNPDNDPRGPWKGASFLNPATPSQRPNLCYEIKNPNTGVITGPTRNAWRRSYDEYQRLGYDNRLYWGLDGKSSVPSIKMFLSEARNLTPVDFWDHQFAGNTDNGTNEQKELFGEKIFENPKPSLLIKRILEHGSASDSIILDFFSGSATTAHAVLELNKEDGGKRQFVLVQMPEATPPESEAARAGYRNIAEIGKERIRRVIQKIQDEKAGELGGTEGLDLGFRVYKLTRSHYKQWQNYYGDNVGTIEELFADHTEVLVPTWRQIEDGLLSEILLMEGYPLHSTVSALPEYPDNCLRLVQSEFHTNRLVVCLDGQLAPRTIEALHLEENDTFICLDSAIDNQLLNRLADKGQVKTI